MSARLLNPRSESPTRDPSVPRGIRVFHAGSESPIRDPSVPRGIRVIHTGSECFMLVIPSNPTRSPLLPSPSSLHLPSPSSHHPTPSPSLHPPPSSSFHYPTYLPSIPYTEVVISYGELDCHSTFARFPLSEVLPAAHERRHPTPAVPCKHSTIRTILCPTDPAAEAHGLRGIPDPMRHLRSHEASRIPMCRGIPDPMRHPGSHEASQIP